MMLTARRIMTDQVVCVGPGTTVARAIERMLAERADVLVVVDDLDQAVGTVAGETLLSAALDDQLRHDPISLHMNRRFAGIETTAPVDQVIDQFVLHRVSHLPVLERGALVGLISWRDVLQAVLRDSTADRPDRSLVPGA